jgi:hypothetical protein
MIMSPERFNRRLTFFRLELDDHSNRAEDLFLHDLHVRLAIRENRRLNEVSLRLEATSTKMNSGALLLSRFYVSHDTLEVVA